MIESFAQFPPEIQGSIVKGVTKIGTWLFTNYGKGVIDTTTDKVIDAIVWHKHIERYYESLAKRVQFVHILGKGETTILENLFTHVNVLNKITAEQWYNIDRLKESHHPRERKRSGDVEERIAGDQAVREHDKLFILGKPGAGKTTFLKHVTLQIIQDKLGKKAIPIFITLKDVELDNESIVDFIVRQFTIHDFPDAANFVEKVLQKGDAIVLFDGLDEVNVGGDKRAKMITAITDFINRYDKCKMLLTCRVSANDYSFAGFKYVEVADFDREQIGRYIDKWFCDDEKKRIGLRNALLEKKANEPVLELAQTPLLLSLLCLAYEEGNKLPAKRDEIYDKATRALLLTWDKRLSITRDGIYRGFSLTHKQDLLAYIAAQTFEKGDYFLKRDHLTRIIDDYLINDHDGVRGDGESVLQEMAAQHGILVERANGIYSFSHLTLQEYYKASYIKEHEAKGTLSQLMTHVGDDRWQEVFLLTASMLDDATDFCEQYVAATTKLIIDDERLVQLLQWCEEKRVTVQDELNYSPSAIRAWYLHQYISLSFFLPVDLDLFRSIFVSLDLNLNDFYQDIINKATDLGYESLAKAIKEMRITMPAYDDPDEAWKQHKNKVKKVIAESGYQYRDPHEIMPFDGSDDRFKLLSKKELELLSTYMKSVKLLVECMEMKTLPTRKKKEIKDKLLLVDG